MKAIELIQSNVPPVRINEPIEKALNWMDEFKLNHIPVVNNMEYIGLLSDEMVYDYNNLSDSISKINFIGNQHFVLENTHFFQVVSFLSKFKLTIVPVCDDQKNYKGSISGKKLLDILQAFVNTGNTVVVIEHNLDVIKTADHIIDMGPEGGVNGGKIIAEGTPEKVSTVKESYTGKFIKEIMGNSSMKKTA